jgi:hypothetical protein
MTDTTATVAKTPWWFWLVCAIAILWNGYGAFDFAASVIQGDSYYRSLKMTDPQIAFMHAYPAWMYVVWFAGTWGAIIASVLLILRSRFAFHAFVISFLGFLMSLVYAYVLSNAREVMGSMVVMHAVITVGCIFFIAFSRRATKSGLLR